jgi:hypothetical protein
VNVNYYVPFQHLNQLASFHDISHECRYTGVHLKPRTLQFIIISRHNMADVSYEVGVPVVFTSARSLECLWLQIFEKLEGKVEVISLAEYEICP